MLPFVGRMAIVLLFFVIASACLAGCSSNPDPEGAQVTADQVDALGKRMRRVQDELEFAQAQQQIRLIYPIERKQGCK